MVFSGCGCQTHWMRRKAILSLVLSLFLLAPAMADTAREGDRPDSPGPLDIKSVAQRHGRKQIVHRLSTYEGWRGRSLRGDNRWIVFWISTNDDPRDPEGFERHIWIDHRHGRLRAVVLRPSGGLHATLDDEVGKATVRRPNRRTIVVRFAERLLGRDIANYRWYAETSWRTRRGPCAPEDRRLTTADNPHPFGLDGACFDRSKELRHRL